MHEHHDHPHEGCCHEHDHHEHDHEGCCCGHEHHDHDHEGCCCGHEHHDHDHEDCCCGHEHHDHDHEACCCGHEHHDHDHEGCCCGHEHHDHEDCCCGHDHEHPEAQDAATRSHTHFVTVHRPVSGHPDDCGCPACNPRVEHCDFCGKALADCACPDPDQGLEKRVYILEGLDCANCAAKVEARIRAMPEVAFAVVSFPTKQLRVTAEDQKNLLPLLQAAVDSVEDGVTVVPRDGAKKEDPHEKSALPGIIAGAVLFVAGVILERMEAPLPVLLIVLAAAYLILGGKVLLTAGRNILRGQVFDENFLMSIATLGAFAIRDFPEAVGVMLFYRVGEYLEDRAMDQSRRQIMDAVDLRPEVVNRISCGNVEVISAEEAKVGDILLVRPGDRIPLDGVIAEGESRIDTSPVTGEPVPVRAVPGDSVLSGCVNTSGQLKLRVEKPLTESMVTRILDSVENAAASKPAMDRFITRFARVYTPAVVIAALAVALVLPFLLPGWHFFVDPGYTGAVGVVYGTEGTASVFTALTFLVISCPCALVLSVPLAFFSGIGTASRKGILFKGGVAIEALSGVKAVVMDKTGTVTRGCFEVQQAIPIADGITADRLLAYGACCELSSTHPIAVSIVAAAKSRGLPAERPLRLEELSGRGIRAETTEGTLLCGSRKLLEENGVELAGCPEAVVGTEVLIALNGVFLGYILISDTIKSDALEAVARIRRWGIATVMLTGDAEESARSVAAQTGIDEVHGRLLPGDKLTRLQQVREKHGSVMFVGDGINDAPVLAGADVGAAMGSGADAAIEAADVVFMNSEMSAIPNAIEIARTTRRISWQNVWFALAVKLVVMVMGLCGFANMWIAVFADTGVSLLCLLNSIRILRMK